MNYTESTAARDTVQVLRIEAARGRAAMHVVNVALARWSAAEVEVELARALPASGRSRWYAETERNFIDWLAAGGFAQPQPLEAAPAQACEAGCTCAV